MKEAPYFRRLPPLRRLLWMHKVTGGGGGSSVIKTVSGASIHITDALAKPLKKLVVNLEPMQSGSGDPAPDNVRPITGWTECNVTDCGKNLFNGTVTNGRINNGAYTSSGSYRCTGYIKVKPSENIVCSANNAVFGMYISEYDKSKTFISTTNITNSYKHLGDTTGYIRVHWGATNYTNVDGKIVLSYGTEPVPYEAYNGTTIPYTFPQEAGTVYGGTLTINDDGSGELTQEYTLVTYDNFDNTGSAYSDKYFRTTFKMVSNNRRGGLDSVCNLFKTKHNDYAPANLGWSYKNDSNGNCYIQFRYDGVTNDGNGTATPNVFRAWVADGHPIQILFEIIDKPTYQLTSQQVITLLQGENNIWADTGDLELTYYADGNVSTLEALNTLLGGRYTNLGTPDDVSDKEALQIILGETT